MHSKNVDELIKFSWARKCSRLFLSWDSPLWNTATIQTSIYSKLQTLSMYRNFHLNTPNYCENPPLWLSQNVRNLSVMETVPHFLLVNNFDISFRVYRLPIPLFMHQPPLSLSSNNGPSSLTLTLNHSPTTHKETWACTETPIPSLSYNSLPPSTHAHTHAHPSSLLLRSWSTSYFPLLRPSHTLPFSHTHTNPPNLRKKKIVEKKELKKKSRSERAYKTYFQNAFP